jgi:diaminobutyrate-2-oxoglutarate transaminase
MVWGIEFADEDFAGSVSEEAFKRGLIIETAGANGQVLKFLPALTIGEELIAEGLEIIDASIASVLEVRKQLRAGTLT